MSPATRRRLATAVAGLLLASLAGCSGRAAFEGLQAWQRLDCQRLPPAEARDCEGRHPPERYDDYRRDRDPR